MKKLILTVVLMFSVGVQAESASTTSSTSPSPSSAPSTSSSTSSNPVSILDLLLGHDPAVLTPAIPTRSGTCEVTPTAFISDESDNKEYELNKPIVPTYYANDKRLWIPFVEYKGEALVAGIWLALDDAGKFGVSSFSEFDNTKNCMPKEIAEEKIVYQDVIKEVEKVVEIEKIVYRDKIVEKEVCSASAGVEAFSTEASYFSRGNVYETTDGHLFIITGTTVGTHTGVGSYYITEDSVFRLTPASLPAPVTPSGRVDYGTKGKYYFLYNGEIAYADFL